MSLNDEKIEKKIKKEQEKSKKMANFLGEKLLDDDFWNDKDSQPRAIPKLFWNIMKTKIPAITTDKEINQNKIMLVGKLKGDKETLIKIFKKIRIYYPTFMFFMGKINSEVIEIECYDESLTYFTILKIVK